MQTGSDPDILNFHVYVFLFQPAGCTQRERPLYISLTIRKTHTHSSLEASGMAASLRRGDLLSRDPAVPFAVHKFLPIG